MATSGALTIVHVGSFPFGLRDAFQHGVAVKLSNGLIRNGHLVLNFSDRDVARARSPFGSRKFGVVPANQALRHFCRFHRPDVLLLGHADVIRPATLEAIRSDLPHLRIGQWNVDPLFEPDNVARIASKFAVVDATFVSTAGEPLAGLRGPGRAVSFLPNPVDFSIERGRADTREQLPHDLFYACGNPHQPLRHICGREWDMESFVRQLHEKIPYARLLLGGLLGRPLLQGAAYQTALESVALGLNISRRPDHYLYSSDRIAQLAGNGVAVVMERATGYGDLFGDDEMVFFNSLDELADRLTQLIAEPRRRMAIAARGRLRYHELFNERTVAAHVLAVLTEQGDPQAVPWMRAP